MTWKKGEQLLEEQLNGPTPVALDSYSSEDVQDGVLNFFNLQDTVDEEVHVDSLPINNRFDIFYEIKNLNSFYKTAGSYLRDYDLGVTSFALIEDSKRSLGQFNGALALASFFDHKRDQEKVLVVAPSLNLDAHEHKTESVTLSTPFGEVSLTLYRYGQNVSALSIEELMKVKSEVANFKALSSSLETLLEDYAVSFWSLPKLSSLKGMKDFIFIVSHFVQNVSIAVKRGKSTQKTLREHKLFFQNYNIPLKGIMVEE